MLTIFVLYDTSEPGIERRVGKGRGKKHAFFWTPIAHV